MAKHNHKPLPGHETQSAEMNCPACGRFVGAVTKCPYCGAKVTKRISLVATRWAAVLLATVGLVLLYFMARSREPATIQIGDIEPTMNFGSVRIVGAVKNDAKPNRSGNGMNFYVTDGSGSLIVFVDETQRQEMLANGLVPKKGDEINFVAQLQASNDSVTARIRSLSEKHFRLSHADAPAPTPADFPAPTPFADVTDALAGKEIALSGTVTDLSVPETGTKRPYVLKLSDGSASKSVKFWQDQYDQIADKDLLKGADVLLRVRVKKARDGSGIDLILNDGADLIRRPPPELTPAQKAAAKAAPARDFSRGRKTAAAARQTPAVAVPVASLTEADSGKTVLVRGRVAQIFPRSGKQPFSLLIRDGDASLRVSWFDNVDAVIPVRPTEGAVFEFEGVLSYWNARPQLTVKSGYKIKLVDDTPPSLPTVDVSSAVPAASLATVSPGTPAVLAGVLSDPVSLKSGVAYTLTDDSGSFRVVLWDSNVPEDLRAALDDGVRAAVSGSVTEFNGVLQLTASRGRSVMVLD
jgi:hypothetical protein